MPKTMMKWSNSAAAAFPYSPTEVKTALDSRKVRVIAGAGLVQVSALDVSLKGFVVSGESHEL